MNDLFLKACRGEPVERPPIWMMRQAGRYMAEYRAVREKVDFVTLCKTPELAAKVTLQPVDLLGVDAAILFSDILVPAEPMGIRMEFRPGPVLDPPVRTAGDVERLRVPDPEADLPYVYETIRLLRRELDGRVPLIGFGPAPLTFCAYLVEGKGSRNFDRLKALLYGDPALAHRLLDKAATALEHYLLAQVRAGAQAIQLFDTWAGILDARDFGEFALPYAKRILDALRTTGVPRIYFALDAGHLWESVAECGADVLGVDWRTTLPEAARRTGGRYVLQGNLDPCVLFAPPDTIRERARRIVSAGRGLRGHVFNLGHGILPNTPVEHARILIDAVKGEST